MSPTAFQLKITNTYTVKANKLLKVKLDPMVPLSLTTHHAYTIEARTLYPFIYYSVIGDLIIY